MNDNRRRFTGYDDQYASPEEVRAYSRYSREGSSDHSASPQSNYARYSRAAMGGRAAAMPRSEAQDASSYYGAAQSSRSRVSERAQAMRKKQRNKRIGLGVLAAALILVLVGAGAAFAYFQSISKNLHGDLDQATLAALEPVAYEGEPFYMLLLGTDKSQQREEDQSTDGIYRTDSIMVARVDPKNVKLTLLSLQRDTLVNMGEYGQQKLNAAYVYGGPKLTIEVAEGLCGVPMSHYAEIGFDGFCSIVDIVGGIDVDVPVEINDDLAGGHVDAGFQTIDGEKALILCRSRHTYDDIGKGDEYRAANQRMVLSALAKKVLQSDLPTLIRVVSEMSKFVTTDLSLNDILSIAASMRGLNPSTDIYSAMTPTTSVYEDEVWYEKLDVEQWTKMMKRVDQGLPPTEETVIDEKSGTVMSSSGDGTNASQFGDTPQEKTYTGPSGGTVVVRNGSMIEGAAAKAAERIAPMGYATETGNAQNSDYPQTLVIYGNRGKADEAADIVSKLGVGKAVLNDGSYNIPDGAKFMIVVGADFH